MKKLMIAAVLALGFAGMSQAANYYWQVSDIHDDAANYLDETFQDMPVYLILQSTWDELASTETRTFDNLQANALSLDGGAKSAAIDIGAWEGTTGVQVYNDGTTVEGSPLDFYAVLATEDGYLLGALNGVQGYDATIAEPEVATVSGETVWSAYDAAGGGMNPWDTITPGPEPGGVPEPTSGLLLLVGLAGMALKRKIA